MTVVPIPSAAADSPTPAPVARLLDRVYAVELVAAEAPLIERFLTELGHARFESASRALASLPPDVAAQAQGLLSERVRIDPADVERILSRAVSLMAAYNSLIAGYDASMAEMARLGITALRNGLRVSGRERDDELRDALKLLGAVLDHPIGGRNHAVWFAAGWARWASGAPLAEAEEAFYQAARLSGSATDGYHVYALRHLAHLQLAQNKGNEAWETARRVLGAGDTDPQVAVEVARCAAVAGDMTQAQAVIDDALAEDASLALSFFAEPDLARLHPAAVRRLREATGFARTSAERAQARLRAAGSVADEIERRVGVSVDAPELIGAIGDTAGASLTEARHWEEDAHRVIDDYRERLVGAIDAEAEKASASVVRMQRLIDQAVREKNYWEGSVKSIEEDAKVSGISLHPYTFNNPLFRKRNQRAEQTRLFYESCKQNQAKAEEFAASQLPRLEEDRARHTARMEALHEARALVQERLG